MFLRKFLRWWSLSVEIDWWWWLKLFRSFQLFSRIPVSSMIKWHKRVTCGRETVINILFFTLFMENKEKLKKKCKVCTPASTSGLLPVYRILDRLKTLIFVVISVTIQVLIQLKMTNKINNWCRTNVSTKIIFLCCKIYASHTGDRVPIYGSQNRNMVALATAYVAHCLKLSVFLTDFI